MNSLRVSLIQNDAGSDVHANLAALEALMDQAEAPDVIALPEIFALRSGADAQKAIAESIPGKISEWLMTQARKRNCCIIGGSLYEQEGDQTFNTMLVVNSEGKESARYRKIHLYNADLESGEVLRESDQFSPGSLPQVAMINEWPTGLSICYDLRFPELYRRYADAQVKLLVVPANFTRHTGEAHWETLLRARAIENQCFVIAPAQCGVHPETAVLTHGHSLIIDPWGRVLADGGEEPGIVEAILDPSLIDKTRQQVPALKHRRL